MTIDDYEFQLTSTGVLLNSDVIFPFVDINRVTGLDSPPFRETTRDHEGADGGFLDAEFESGRDVILEGILYADATTMEAYLDDIKENYAPVTDPIPFYIKPPGVDERVIFVKSRGARYDWATLRRLGMTEIQFLLYAEDPRIYDNVLMNTVIPFGGQATTGFGFDFGFDLSFGASVPPDGAFIINSGNRPTPLIFTISGPVVDPRIINDAESKSMNFSITLGASDVLVIDTSNKTVLLNGSTNRRNALLTQDWFFLNVGSTFIRFGGASGTGTLSVSYRNAWR